MISLTVRAPAPRLIAITRPGLLLGAVLLFLLGASPIQAQDVSNQRKPTIIITVDVESNDEVGLPEQLHAKCAGGIPCGIEEMGAQLKRRGYGATFFLNVYERKTWGDESMSRIAAWLDGSGQDVELHTHPHWAYDPSRVYMHQYSLEEQIKIIREGRELIRGWTGKDVTTHRAGAYGADANTLQALIQNGIYYDSSLFYGRETCKINSLGLKKNSLSMFGPLYELPVTVYREIGYPPRLGSRFKPVSMIKKYDMNWFANQEEATHALDRAVASQMDFVVLFLHSYSFIKRGSRAGTLTADQKAIQTFSTVLDYIRSEGLSVMTFRELSERGPTLTQLGVTDDTIPNVNRRITLVKFVAKRLGVDRKNYGLIVSLVCASCVILIAAALVVRRRR